MPTTTIGVDWRDKRAGQGGAGGSEKIMRVGQVESTVHTYTIVTSEVVNPLP